MYFIILFSRQPTFARMADPGRPFSRAKAHAILDEVARKPMVAKTMAAIMTEVYRILAVMIDPR